MKIRNAVLFAAVAACSVAAHAANPFIRDVNNQVSVQAISTDVDYKEKDGSGTVLDTEKGGVLHTVLHCYQGADGVILFRLKHNYELSSLEIR